MRKLLKKTGKMIALAAGLSFVLGMSSFAAEKNLDPMLYTQGSIEITVDKESPTDTDVPGGNALIYQVAELKRNTDTGEYYYDWIQAIKDLKAKPGNTLKLDISDLGKSAEKTANLAGEVDQAVQTLGLALAKPEQNFDTKGHISFGADLPLGLYIIRQTKAASGYDLIDSFLVTLPMYTEADGYYFEVNAYPKLSITKPATPPGGDNPPDEHVPHRGGGGGGGGGSSTPPSGSVNPPSDEGVLGASRDSDTPAEEPQQVLGASRLPQTGQLKWPVSVMSILGLFFLLGGTALRRSEESSDR